MRLVITDPLCLSSQQRQIRMHIRNFLMLATPDQLKKELEISQQRPDPFRAACVQELIDES